MQTRINEELYKNRLTAIKVSLTPTDGAADHHTLQTNITTATQFLTELVAQRSALSIETLILCSETYAALSQAQERNNNFSDAYEMLKEAWKILMAAKLPQADAIRHRMTLLSKKNKALERLAALSHFPCYEWSDYRTASEFQQYLPKIEEYVSKLLAIKDELNQTQKALVANKCYELGNFYLHAKNKTDNASEYYKVALHSITAGMPKNWLLSQMALQTQTLINDVKRQNFSADKKNQLATGLATQCQLFLQSIVLPPLPDKGSESERASQQKLRLFISYIECLLDFSILEIRDTSPDKSAHLSLLAPLATRLEAALQIGPLTALEDDLILKTKSFYSYILTIMTNPQRDPAPIYAECITFLERVTEQFNPEALTIYLHHAKFLNRLAKRDESPALYEKVLDEYHKAQTILLVTGRENTPKEIEVSRYMAHLQGKIARLRGEHCYTPRLFTPAVTPVLGPEPSPMESVFRISITPPQPVSTPTSRSLPPRG